jgi:K+-transporting ATPase ATPase C chain
MRTHFRPALVLFTVLTVLTGIVYPLAVTAVSHTAFPEAAAGSLVRDGNRVIGSSLIGQHFTGPGHFWGRPSATAPTPYNAMASGGSNLGPLNPALADAVRDRIAVLRAADPGNLAPVPLDLVTASASGLDPHITPAAAAYQVARVARAHGLPAGEVQQLVALHTEMPRWGFLGEPRVDVLALNRAIDARAAR